MNEKNNFNFIGYGIGLRPQHYCDLLESKPKIDFLEILTENYLVEGGKPLYYLDKIKELYPMTMHGVSLNLGSTDSLDFLYLNKVKDLVNRVQPLWISDHLCWTGVSGKNSHDLLPLPYTDKVIQHVTDRINQVQDFFGREILIENISTYLTYKDSSMSEWEFLSEISKHTGCFILLDINNVYVNAYNHRFNPMDYIKNISKISVKQFHLSGHTNKVDYIIDTHDAPVIDQVWELYKEATKYFGAIPTIIERDDKLPPLSALLEEMEYARLVGALSY